MEVVTDKTRPVVHRYAPHTRHIAGPRISPDDWQAWLARHVSQAGDGPPWLPVAGRLVVVAPHPDDEVLACGGLLHAHLQRGGTALVVAVTDGEASHAGDPDWPAPRLAARRSAESATGLHRLAAGRALPVLRLRYPDGGVAQYAVRLQVQLDALLQPQDVVLATCRWDGHPDHEACGHAAAAAAARKGCGLVEAPVWMWHWAGTDDPQIPWHQLCAVPLAPQAAALKGEALADHGSQHAPRSGGRPPILDGAIRARASWPTEYFFVAR